MTDDQKQAIRAILHDVHDHIIPVHVALDRIEEIVSSEALRQQLCGGSDEQFDA